MIKYVCSKCEKIIDYEDSYSVSILGKHGIDDEFVYDIDEVYKVCRDCAYKIKHYLDEGYEADETI